MMSPSLPYYVDAKKQKTKKTAAVIGVARTNIVLAVRYKFHPVLCSWYVSAWRQEDGSAGTLVAMTKKMSYSVSTIVAVKK